MTVCSCPAVVEVTIVRPDLKYQLGFSVQKGMVCDCNYSNVVSRKQLSGRIQSKHLYQHTKESGGSQRGY